MYVGKTYDGNGKYYLRANNLKMSILFKIKNSILNG